MIKASGLKPAYSELIQILKTPKVDLWAKPTVLRPFVGQEFQVMVNISDQYGTMYGEDEVVELTSDPNLIGPKSLTTHNSTCIFTLRTFEPGDLNLTFRSLNFSKSLILPIQKNNISLSHLPNFVISKKTQTYKETFNISFKVVSGQSNLTESSGLYLFSIKALPLGSLLCASNQITVKNGLGSFQNCHFETSGVLNLSITSDKTEDFILGPFTVFNPSTKSIKLVLPTVKVSALIDFPVKVQLFSSGNVLVEEPHLLAVSYSQHISGPEYLLYSGGSAEGLYYSKSPGSASFTIEICGKSQTEYLNVKSNSIKFIKFEPVVIEM